MLLIRLDHSVVGRVYLHPLLFSGQQQDLYRILYGLADLSFLELVD